MKHEKDMIDLDELFDLDGVCPVCNDTGDLGPETANPETGECEPCPACGEDDDDE
jgi:hypothetical protein